MNIGQQMLEKLKDEIPEIEYNRYIQQLSFDEKRSSGDYAVYYAPNVLIANYIKTKYSQRIAHLFEIQNSHKVTVNVTTKNTVVKTAKKNSSSVDKEKTKHSLLNPSHTFENFVVGGSNQFAYAAAKSVSERPGDIYNPLFIYGGVGIGKTHLMQAVGNVLQERGKDVIYTSVEQFLNDFLRHLRNGNMEKFKDKYRKCDILLIDDIQFLSNKDSIQEEFFHTFEALRNDKKQIIMTADKHPKKIGGLEERLKSRFEWGLIADIQPPELETKINIIKKKCEINRVVLNNDVINYIATIIENNAREIEGILSKLHAYSKLMNIDITIEFTKNVLKEQLRENRANITIDSIINTVAKELNVKPSEIKSKSRSRNIVYARRIAIYLCRDLTANTTMPQLAQYFGMKDHTAISHTMKKINGLIENDEDFKTTINELTNKITSSS
jgi:chromosomal replication initiator protein